MNLIVKFNATYDKVFKSAFEQKLPCSALINAILGSNYTPEDITYINTEQKNLSLKTKKAIFDINLITKNSYISLEMQKFKPNYNLRDRLLYYVLFNYAKSFLTGDDYIGTPTILICFTDYNFHKDTCVNIYTVNNYKDDEFLGIKIIIIDLTKLENCDNIELKKWLKLIKRNDFEDFKGENEAMNDFVKRVIEMNNNGEWLDILHRDLLKFEEQAQKRWEEKIKAQATEQGLKEGLEQGIKEGLEQGLKQGKETNQKELIIRMFNNGLSIENISKYTNIDIETIKTYLK